MLALQKDEHTEKLVYERLGNAVTNQRNRQVLARIARDEDSHCRFWMRYTGQEVASRPGCISFCLSSLASRLA
jgi:rubrerythrin